MPTNDGIPDFLRLTEEERKEAWKKYRDERKLIAEQKTYKPITGAAPDAVA